MIALIPKRPFRLSVSYMYICLPDSGLWQGRITVFVVLDLEGGRERWRDELNPALLPLGLRLTDERRRWEQSNNSGGKGAALATSAHPKFRPHLHEINLISFSWIEKIRVNPLLYQYTWQASVVYLKWFKIECNQVYSPNCCLGMGKYGALTQRESESKIKSHIARLGRQP